MCMTLNLLKEGKLMMKIITKLQNAYSEGHFIEKKKKKTFSYNPSTIIVGNIRISPEILKYRCSDIEIVNRFVGNACILRDSVSKKTVRYQYNESLQKEYTFWHWFKTRFLKRAY